jgi:predicted PurR-regulated permease PerM
MNTELTTWIKKILILIWITSLLYLLFILKELVIILLISGFITLIINPLVVRWERYRIPAWLTVIGVYIVIIILGSIVIWTIIPIVGSYISDTTTLIITWANTAQSVYLKEWLSGFHFHPYIVQVIDFTLGKENLAHTLDIIKQNAGNIQTFLTTQISTLTTGGISLVSTVGGVVAEWILIGITAFFMILERKQIGKFIINISPKNIDKYLQNHYIQIQWVCNSWIKASLILCVSIFVTTYIWLIIAQSIFDFDTERTFTLALISGIMEFIPYVGPILALVPALIIGLGISWEAAAVLTILYLIIQQFENNVLVPYVMSKNLDLSPFLVFIVMLAGASLGGILGIILAIPVAWVCRVIYIEYKKNQTSTGIIDKDTTDEEGTQTKKQKTPTKKMIGE